VIIVTPAQNTSNELPFKFGECLWVTDSVFQEVFDKTFESVFDRSFFVHNGPPQSFMSAVLRIVQFLSTPSGSTGLQRAWESPIAPSLTVSHGSVAVLSVVRSSCSMSLLERHPQRSTRPGDGLAESYLNFHCNILGTERHGLRERLKLERQLRLLCSERDLFRVSCPA
jgi:hypothetical protein